MNEKNAHSERVIFVPYWNMAEGKNDFQCACFDLLQIARCDWLG